MTKILKGKITPINEVKTKITISSNNQRRKDSEILGFDVLRKFRDVP